MCQHWFHGFDVHKRQQFIIDELKALSSKRLQYGFHWFDTHRVTICRLISMREIDVGDRYGRLDINEISIGIPIWETIYRYVIHYIDMDILDIDMGYGLMM